jgi:hypothetical protein
MAMSFFIQRFCRMTTLLSKPDGGIFILNPAMVATLGN